jgi:uncharacterized lipoprotein YddW (UPF0748 family)
MLAASALYSQLPKHEVRAVWISTASGDWPNSTKKDEQQRSLREILDAVKKNNLNTVFFQVRPRGNTYYRSDIEPWASHLTGTTGSDPGWDPLQFAIDESRKRGLELHAWFNVAKVWGLDTPPTHPAHLLKKRRDWVQQRDGEWWIDMGIPDAREYTVRLVREIAERYDVDGIHFDFIRYPDDRFDDGESFRRWSNGMERDEWRRNNITAFVRESYSAVRSIAPWIKIGSAPIGIYRSINGTPSSFNGYSGVFQDSRLWLREGIHDYLVPQIYWSVGEQQDPYDPDFAYLAFDWARESSGRHVYAGLGIYRDHIRPETAEQIRISRKAGMNGQAFFRYDHLISVSGQISTVYRFPALVPAMQWKDSLHPLPPVNMTSEYHNDGTSLVRWSPDPRSTEQPFRFAIYRSQHDPVDTRRAENLLAVIPGDRTSYRDEAASGNGIRYQYTVTALDRNWNESASENFAGVATPARPAAETAAVVSSNYPESFSARTYISLSLPRSEFVTIILKHSETRQESVIVRETKKKGIHIVALNAADLPPGPIECEVQAGDFMTVIAMTKK